MSNHDQSDSEHNQDAVTESTAQDTREATLSLFGAVRGYEESGGWSFTLTDPLKHMGVTDEMLTSGDDPVIVFDRPDDAHGNPHNELMGVLKMGITDGRGATNARKIMGMNLPNGSYRLRFTDDALNEIGVNCDIDTGDPPVIEVWAGDGVISLSPLHSEQVAVTESPHTALHVLPDQLREDFEAVELDDYTAAEWAEERGLTDTADSTYDPEYYINNNVKKAKQKLGSGTVDALKSAAESGDLSEETELLTVPIQRAQLVDTSRGATYRLTVTEAVKRALPEDEWGKSAVVYFDPLSGIVGGEIETFESKEETPQGAGRENLRRLQYEEAADRYQLRLPQSAVKELGYDPDEDAGEYINIFAGDHTLGFSPSRHATREISEPELTKRYNAGDQA